MSTFKRALTGKQVLVLAFLGLTLAPAVRAEVPDSIRAAYEKKDYVALVSILTPMANNGEVDAQVDLCRLSIEGLGVPKDYRVAAGWCGKAAGHGSRMAQYILGVFYNKGLGGLSLSLDEALKLFRAAAAQGQPGAEYELGVLSLLGRGVQKDEKIAINWFRRAAEQHDRRALHSLGVAYQRGRGVQQDARLAVSLFKQSAAQGYGPALSALGGMHGDGTGVPQDYALAMKYLKEAVSMGDFRAAHSVGMLYDSGRGVPEDGTEALRWYAKAAERGFAKSQWMIGSAYVVGRFIERDFVKAHVWFNLAASNGDDAIQERDNLAKQMTAAQLEEAQRLAREFKPAGPLFVEPDVTF